MHGIVKEELLDVQKLQLLQSITILYFHVENAPPTFNNFLNNLYIFMVISQ
jgi:hypothetical protein